MPHKFDVFKIITVLKKISNEPHYPDLNNYPHHFHYKDNIGASLLSGKPIQDVKKVCSFVKGMIESIQNL